MNLLQNQISIFPFISVDGKIITSNDIITSLNVPLILNKPQNLFYDNSSLTDSVEIYLSNIEIYSIKYVSPNYQLILITEYLPEFIGSSVDPRVGYKEVYFLTINDTNKSINFSNKIAQHYSLSNICLYSTYVLNPEKYIIYISDITSTINDTNRTTQISNSRVIKKNLFTGVEDILNIDLTKYVTTVNGFMHHDSSYAVQYIYSPLFLELSNNKYAICYYNKNILSTLNDTQYLSFNSIDIVDENFNVITSYSNVKGFLYSSHINYNKNEYWKLPDRLEVEIIDDKTSLLLINAFKYIFNNESNTLQYSGEL